jgi:hypothetical protein
VPDAPQSISSAEVRALLSGDLPADVVVLPRRMDAEGRGLYHDSVLSLVKTFKADGIDAAFLHDSDQRGWIGEKSLTTDFLTLALGVGSAAGWDGVKRLFRGRLSSSQTKAVIYRKTEDPSGKSVWEMYEFEGSGEDVATLMERLPPPASPPDDSDLKRD